MRQSASFLRREITKAFVILGLLLSIASLSSASVFAESVGDLVHADVGFEVPGTELIPNVAAVRASCHLNASGEAIVLLANGTVRSTLAASPGPCTIVLVFLGVDVTLPVFNTTPLGRNSFYVPGIATLSFGVVDLTLDLVTSLNSTSRVAGGIAAVSPEVIAWSTWGAQRISVDAADGVGSIARSELNTTFTYTMSIALTVYLLSLELFHRDLAAIGSVDGAPSLVTDLAVNLRPHALALDTPSNVEADRASLSWSGTVDSDVDHLELQLTDATSNVTYRVPPTATHVDVLLQPSTHYEARIVSVDRSGQEASSNTVVFDSAAAPASPTPTPIEAQGNPVVTWTLVALAVLAAIVAYAVGFLRSRKDH